jgi:hypothetical protein
MKKNSEIFLFSVVGLLLVSAVGNSTVFAGEQPPTVILKSK